LVRPDSYNLQVTDFLSEHPGGAKIILKLAGKDATEEYDPIHPPGILEENLKPEALLGTVNPDTLPKGQAEPSPVASEESKGQVPMEALLNMDDIEQVATKNVSRKAWAYYYSASDDKITKRFNTEVYRSIILRPRVFIDCTKCDLDTSFLGHKLGMPIYVSPAAMARLGHPAGEAGIAEACRSFGAMQIISNNASMTPEQIVKDAAPDQVFGWQIYVQIDRKKSEAMLARINKLKAIKFIVLTLDAPVPGKREDDERGNNVAASMPVPSAAKVADKAADGTPDVSQAGGVGKQLFAGTAPSLTWKDTLPWLAKHTDLPIVLKGLQTHEDAYIASLHTPQVKGIILSNHGGRALDTAPPAVHSLLEIRKYCPEVFDKLDVWVDGGIRRGTDVVKALCLGAKAVGIGRPALWGLGAGGVDGVKRTLESMFHPQE
jgi:L-lactate dehydrogenase (cytochrome)